MVPISLYERGEDGHVERQEVLPKERFQVIEKQAEGLVAADFLPYTGCVQFMLCNQ